MKPETSATSETETSKGRSPSVGRAGYYVPVAIFLGMAVFFAIGLTLDPSKIPSPLIGKPVPKFDLPPVMGRTLGLSDKNLVGEVSMVNVWASWCPA